MFLIPTKLNLFQQTIGQILRQVGFNAVAAHDSALGSPTQKIRILLLFPVIKIAVERNIFQTAAGGKHIQIKRVGTEQFFGFGMQYQQFLFRYAPVKIHFFTMGQTTDAFNVAGAGNC